MLIKVNEAKGQVLNWMVAKAQGCAMRPTVNARSVDIEHLSTPFTLKEVVCTYRNGKAISAQVKDIQVTRYGINTSNGARASSGTPPSISFIDQDGNEAIGYADMFFLTQEEAEIEAASILYGNAEDFNPTEDWSIAGPIIERDGISLKKNSIAPAKAKWQAYSDDMQTSTYGPSTLIAAMRCYAASKLGEEVDVPDELMQDSNSNIPRQRG